jgi:MSHA biogenesis protein MshJ
VKPLDPITQRLGALAQRLNALSLRERGLIFFAGATLVYIAWQTLLMGPLTVREHNAEQRLIEARRRQSDIEKVGLAAAGIEDPVVLAAARNKALKGRLTALDSELHSAAQGYVAPERMTEMLRQILAEQHGLKLVSLVNLPVMSLSQAQNPAAGRNAAVDLASAPGGTRSGGSTPAGPTDSRDIGPFLHPVELVVEGDYASLTAYLRALEALPWRIHWQQLELRAGDYPSSTVHLVIGALSLSRDWINI